MQGRPAHSLPEDGESCPDRRGSGPVSEGPACRYVMKEGDDFSNSFTSYIFSYRHWRHRRRTVLWGNSPDAPGPGQLGHR